MRSLCTLLQDRGRRIQVKAMHHCLFFWFFLEAVNSNIVVHIRLRQIFHFTAEARRLNSKTPKQTSVLKQLRRTMKTQRLFSPRKAQRDGDLVQSRGRKK